MRYARSILIWTLLAVLLVPDLGAQAVRLTASPVPVGYGSFGVSVDIDGDYAVVGAPFEDLDTGAAYVFFRDPVEGWTQQARLTNDDRAVGDAFGHSVDIDGSFLLIGAPGNGDEGGADAGAAFVFFRDPTLGWRQQARLTATDPALNDRFGYTVALSSIFAFVAAPFNDDDGTDSGSVYAYAFTGNDTWRQQEKLTAPDADAGDTFGMALALDGETALIGSPNADDPRGGSAGLAYVFARSAGSSWFVRAVLTAGDAEGGNHFGAAVALATDPLTEVQYALIGAPDAGTRDIGAAYVFTELDMLWTQIAQFVPDEVTSGDNIGAAVALSGNYALVGAPGIDTGPFNTNTGAAYLLFNDPAIGWHQRATLTAPTPEPEACFACALALDGDYLLVGSSSADGELPDVGAVYVYDHTTVFTSLEDPPDRPVSLPAPTNYPNPFRPTTTIAFEVPAKTRRLPVRLAIYDIQGREVRVLIDHPLRPGRHEIDWAAAGLPTGVYAYQLTIGDQTMTRRMLRIR